MKKLFYPSIAKAVNIQHSSTETRWPFWFSRKLLMTPLSSVISINNKVIYSHLRLIVTWIFSISISPILISLLPAWSSEWYCRCRHTNVQKEVKSWRQDTLTLKFLKIILTRKLSIFKSRGPEVLTRNSLRILSPIIGLSTNLPSFSEPIQPSNDKNARKMQQTMCNQLTSQDSQTFQEPLAHFPFKRHEYLWEKRKNGHNEVNLLPVSGL